MQFASFVVLRSSLRPRGLCRVALYPLFLPTKPLSTGAQASFTGDLVTFTARLDGLRKDQIPDYLSKALRAAFEERELHDVYISSLREDQERVKVLLEVFDKVRSAATVSRELILTITGRNRLLRLLRTMSRSLSNFDNSAVGQGFYQPHTSFPKSSSEQLRIPLHLALLAMFGKASTTINEWR